MVILYGLRSLTQNPGNKMFLLSLNLTLYSIILLLYCTVLYNIKISIIGEVDLNIYKH